MADVFVSSAKGGGGDDGTTWANAFLTFAQATGAAAGSRIVLDSAHSESLAGAIWTFTNGVDTNPIIVMSSLVDSSPPSYLKAPSVQVTHTSASIAVRNSCKFFGVFFLADDKEIDFRAGSTHYCMFDDSVLEINANEQFFIGNDGSLVYLKNTEVNFSLGGSNTTFRFVGNSTFIWEGGLLSRTGTVPSAMFGLFNGTNVAQIIGVNLIAQDNSTALVNAASGGAAIINFSGCQLHSSVSLSTGTMQRAGNRITMSECDDGTGNELFRFEYEDFWGFTSHDKDTFYLASDGVTPFSWKLTTTGGQAREATEEAHVSPEITLRNSALVSTVFTLNVYRDNATLLQDDEIYAVFEYFDASGNTQSVFVNDVGKRADIGAVPANRSTISDPGWTEDGSPSNPTYYELKATITPGRVGPVRAKVYLPKTTSGDIWVDGKMVAVAA